MQLGDRAGLQNKNIGHGKAGYLGSCHRQLFDLFAADQELGRPILNLPGELAGRSVRTAGRMDAFGGDHTKEEARQYGLAERDGQHDIFTRPFLANAVLLAQEEGELFGYCPRLGFSDDMGWVLSLGIERGALNGSAVSRLCWSGGAVRMTTTVSAAGKIALNTTTTLLLSCSGVPFGWERPPARKSCVKITLQKWEQTDIPKRNVNTSMLGTSTMFPWL